LRSKNTSYPFSNQKWNIFRVVWD